METLVLDGKTYVKASKAAKALGYTSDYVGQLCRSGKVDAHLVGRSWYVSQDELGEHRVEKKRLSRVKAREQVRRAVEEHQANTTDQHSAKYKRNEGSYEEDSSELIPKVRKISVETIETSKHSEGDIDDSDKYTVENEGDKVVMSGSVAVIDATDEDLLDGNTVYLSPNFTKVTARKTIITHKGKQKKHQDISQNKPDFLSKLDELETNLEPDEASVPVTYDDVETVVERSSFSVTKVVLTVSAVLLALGSVTIEGIWSYGSNFDLEGGTHFESNFNVDASLFLAKVPFNK